MWAADESHSAVVQLLIQRGADVNARSNSAPRGRGPALGKANDPRRQVAAQGAALAAGQPAPPLGGGRAGATGAAQGRGGAAGAAGGAQQGRGGGRGGRGGGAAAGNGAAADGADQTD